MRVFIAVIFGCCMAASANPLVVRPSDFKKGVYIASEHLVITVSETNAQVQGTFTFGSGLSRKRLAQTSALLLLPIWFPETNMQDASVAAFWESFKKDEFNPLTDLNRACFAEALGLKVTIGQEPISVNRFAVLTTNPFKARDTSGWGSFRFVQEPGFCCVVIEVLHSPEFIWKHLPVTVSYRQPLLHTNGNGLFCYTPIFDPIPKGLSTRSTKHYSITVTASPECSLTWLTRIKEVTVEPGKSWTFAPGSWEPFRVVAKRRPDKQSGAGTTDFHRNP
jgi:hypothetical protein